MTKRRERRRNKRLRRLVNCAYGLSLAVSAPCPGWAADTGKLFIKPGHGELRGAANPGQQSSRSFRLVFLQLEPRDLFAPCDDELPIWDHRHPHNQRLLQALDRVDVDDLEYQDNSLAAMRDGLGLDLGLLPMGQLHFNLYTNRHALSRGMRIQVNPLDASAHDNGLWSLGASLDTARTANGEDIVDLVPQLMLDLDGLLDSETRMRALVEYGHWQPLHQAVTTNARVAQISLRLEF